MRTRTLIATLICATTTVAAAGTVLATAPRSASPGAEDRVLAIETRCPTFTWEPVPGAVFSQLVAYRLPETSDAADALTAELGTENEALYAEIPGGAGAWTPSAEQCLEPGGRYVWFVRAVHEMAGDEVVAASEWSRGRYFAVMATPSAEELRQALDVLRRWEAGGSEPQAISVAATADDRRSPVRSQIASAALSKSVPTASAAIRGAHPARSGEAYGVVGTSGSPDGAGLAAANTDGGPDLVLDGSGDSAPDLFLSQAGAWTSSRNATVFHLANTDTGTMSLDVEGGMTAAALDCPLCVDAADLNTNAVTTAKIATGAVTSTKIASSAVTSAAIADGTITAADISPSAALDADTLDGHDSSSFQPKIRIEDAASSNYHELQETCNEVGSVSIDTTGPGVVLFEATAYVWMYHTAGQRDRAELYADTTAGSCAEHPTNATFLIPAPPPSSLAYGSTITVRRLFPVSASGTQSYYLNALKAADSSYGKVERWYVTATFIPG